jgi:rhamnosyltransferase
MVDPTRERGPACLAAGIVVFEPEPAILQGLIAAVAPNVGAVLVFVNALSDDGLREILHRTDKVVLIESQVNLGVGAALNILVLNAALAGYQRIVVFDQDSRPDATVVPTLAGTFDDLLAVGEVPAVVGPRLISPPESRYKEPRYFGRKDHRRLPGLVAVQFLPTSGSLISIDAFRKVGTFRGDYFIDGIDLEWGFRAWSCGFSCWCADQVTMPHTVGEGVYEARSLGISTPRQRDFRFETYVRNTIYGLRLRHIPLSWKIRQLGYMGVQFITTAVASRFRLPLMKSFVRGFSNGLRGRLGPPDGAKFT